jgi:hypothetical protein
MSDESSVMEERNDFIMLFFHHIEEKNHEE